MMYDVTMRRTQMLLEEWQYQTLRARAEREGRSISEVVREILRVSLERPSTRKSKLTSIEGVGADASASGRGHDGYLYGDRDD